MLTSTGWVRKISGLSQGEILLRRFKKNTYYSAVAASTIVEEWASDLSLGDGVDAEATTVDLEVKTKSYFDLLRWISDYWASAGTQLKKDFWVDLSGDLVWKDRPLRTVGVETVSTSDFLTDPLVTREIDPVRNDIVVYGAAEASLPRDKDSYSDALTDWTASIGTLSLNNAVKKVGTNSIQCLSGPEDDVKFKRDIPLTTIRSINELNFWRRHTTVPVTSVVRLLTPDASNYFEADMGTATAWTWKSYSLGDSYIYDANENPEGVWTETGTGNWWNIEYIQFYVDFGATAEAIQVDALYWDNDRWTNSATDATSKSNYGQRDLEVTDDKLLSH